ncbi:14861_t:CDS:2 [Cetraspora pellucida]|uniref:14861_t:CDS:1 n=1 Tax=Cetraspora pellucida TaxID=1433469 RepID=A0A9N9ELZ3_9GLOM|nr:14861_t:CDS:2 [Cetraspora pellucida]
MSVGTVISQPISDLTFIKGDPVTIGDQHNPVPVLVVEFWATWCPPCRDSIPHLTDIQQKFQNVTILGVTYEKDVDKITEFVKSMGDKMNYTVAVDTNESAKNAIFTPSNARGIPTAYILVKNKIVWQGHPMGENFETELQNAISQVESIVEQIALPRITESFDDLMQKPVKELKTILEDRGISIVGCLEKPDFAK